MLNRFCEKKKNFLINVQTRQKKNISLNLLKIILGLAPTSKKLTQKIKLLKKLNQSFNLI